VEDLFATLAKGEVFTKLDWHKHTSSSSWIKVCGY